jgi:hypothetical protein
MSQQDEADRMSRDEAVQQARKLVAQKWNVLVCDIPETGMMGLYAFRYINPDTREVLTPPFEPEKAFEETKMLEWPVYGKPMTEVDDKMVEVDDLIRFIGDSRENLALCDDPKGRRLGFVRYDPEKGRSMVRRVRLTQVRSSSKEVRERFMPLRDELQQRSKADHEKLVREVHA